MWLKYKSKKFKKEIELSPVEWSPLEKNIFPGGNEKNINDANCSTRDFLKTA